MNIGVLLYVYMIICLSIILFNCAYIFISKKKQDSILVNRTIFQGHIGKQIDRIDKGEDIEEEHRSYIRKALLNANNMMAFDEALEIIYIDHTDPAQKYLEGMRSVFIYLVLTYVRKDITLVTFVLYIVSKYKIFRNQKYSVIADIAFLLLKNENLYCRENALKLIYSIEDCECVSRALMIIDRSEHFHNSKLITDGLSSFSGNYNSLAAELWDHMDDYSVQMKVSILNFLRFNLGNQGDKMLLLLTDLKQDDEVKYACIRYFGKYYNEKAYPIILKYAGDTDNTNWLYTSIACQALSIYKTEESINVLTENLSSPHWYVRYNASQSLLRFSLSYNDLIDVMDGNDRYAQEIMQYRFDVKRMEKKDVTALSQI